MSNDKKNTQSLKWQLTINNPGAEFSHEKIIEILSLKFKTYCYCAMCDEIGANKTFHTHLFACFTSGVRFTTLKKHFPTAHIESARGSIKQNIEYLLKSGKWEDTKKSETTVPNSFLEHGIKPQENLGKRADLEKLYHMIVDDGLSNAEIIRTNKDFIFRLDDINKIRTTHLQDKYKGTRRLDLEVVYVYGMTGKGKTRNILDEHGDENVYRVTDYKHPFDGYTTESVLVFEEFRNSLTLKDMLNYLDIYPLLLPARYANKYACYTTVYICINWKLEKQYEHEQCDDRESYNAFLRRIHRVKEYTEIGIVEYDSVQSYLERNNKFKAVTELPKVEQLEIETIFPPEK